MNLAAWLVRPRWLLNGASVRSKCFHNAAAIPFRTFTTTACLNGGSKPPIPPRTPIPANDLTVAYLKGSGPGGQKINKTNSAVQIKHLPSGTVIKCQETRSRDQNEKLAIRKLQDRLEEMEKGTDSRVGRRHELLRRRKRTAAKKARRKYGAKGGDGKDNEKDEDDQAAEGEQTETDASEDNLQIVQAVIDTVKSAQEKPNRN